ncbi:hypothetical protein BDV19DRAFT_175386 [Aspergillus venezuelensis]
MCDGERATECDPPTGRWQIGGSASLGTRERLRISHRNPGRVICGFVGGRAVSVARGMRIVPTRRRPVPPSGLTPSIIISPRATVFNKALSVTDRRLPAAFQKDLGAQGTGKDPEKSSGYRISSGSKSSGGVGKPRSCSFASPRGKGGTELRSSSLLRDSGCHG